MPHCECESMDDDCLIDDVDSTSIVVPSIVVPNVLSESSSDKPPGACLRLFARFSPPESSEYPVVVVGLLVFRVYWTSFAMGAIHVKLKPTVNSTRLWRSQFRQTVRSDKRPLTGMSSSGYCLLSNPSFQRPELERSGKARWQYTL